MALHPVLLEKLNAAVPGKVHAVIGMRRAGKTPSDHPRSTAGRAASATLFVHPLSK